MNKKQPDVMWERKCKCLFWETYRGDKGKEEKSPFWQACNGNVCNHKTASPKPFCLSTLSHPTEWEFEFSDQVYALHTATHTGL